ncbi:MAG: hypothetical protein COA96_04590 [SAR86 cluster bacterium]|uniref:Uncharacterized protein n=1 Tax=SAR86 cluster bacterium TaxID=2030880 RepID=A0A2A5B5Z9_9GAMM|nr:MAG: hypothetical protein COA96_04590 [SAR86 cluster bacterium]
MNFERKDITKVKVALLTIILPIFFNTAVAQLPYEYATQSYQSGQHTELAYEGWRVNQEGNTILTFGYFNHNWKEELDISIGENNFFSPGEVDRGQPTHFLPRRNRFTFDVVVPSDFDENDELVWEVTSPNGLSRQAYGTLREDYKLDNVVIMSETGALGAGTSDVRTRANIPPVLEVIGDRIRAIEVGKPLVVQARVTDDGVPEPIDPMKEALEDAGAAAIFLTPAILRREIMMIVPPRPTVNKNNGLFLSWNVYRAPETEKPVQEIVNFEPQQVKPWEDTRPSANSPWSFLWMPPKLPEDGVITTTVIFDEPGTYLLWARADDGGLYSDTYVTVNVSP